MADTLRQQVERRLDALKTLRSDYEPEWFDIARFAMPSRSRFLGRKGTTNKPDQRTQRRQWNSNLLDPKGIEAFRTLGHGMTSGLSSNSRPWFTLTLKQEMMEEEGVRDWLSEVERRMYGFLASTNFYGAAKSGYHENGLFGTEACVMLENADEGMVCHSLTAGEYWIACGETLKPDVLYRQCPMTVREVVHTFGDDAPKYARREFDKSNYAKMCEVYQAIEPDTDYDPSRFGSKPWRSIYWDLNDTDKSNPDRIIRKRGFSEQPFWAARWDAVSGETWGSSPGMDALPSLREAQMQAKRRNETIDGIVKPEMVAPAGIRLTRQPGRTVSSAGQIDKNSVFAPYVPSYQAVQAIGEEIAKTHQQIDALSFAELFNAITNMQGIQPRTVEEIAARNEEKLTQLGPVIERVSNEKLEIVIDRVFGIMERGGLLPPVPKAIAGMTLNVEFVSILTQMQRMVGIGQIERTVAFAGNTAGVAPEVLDVLDPDETMREYASRAGAPAKMVRSEREVEKMRQAKAQQQQMAQAAEMAAPAKDAVEAARLASETDDQGRSLMDRVTGAY